MAATTMERARAEREKRIKFIKLIQKFSAVWDIECKEYKDKEEKRKAIEAMEMGWSVSQVTDKYENLRTYYRKEKRKVFCCRKSRAGTTDGYKSKWIFFDALDEFLKDSLKNRPESSNLSECLSGESDEEEIVNGSLLHVTTTAAPRRKRPEKEDDLSAVLGVLKDSMRQEEAKPGSKDSLFGQYIACQMEDIPEGRKKEFLKIRILLLILEAQFEDDIPRLP